MSKSEVWIGCLAIVGIMAILIGVVMFALWPNLDSLAASIILVGLASVIVGFAYTIYTDPPWRGWSFREGQQKQKRN